MFIVSPCRTTTVGEEKCEVQTLVKKRKAAVTAKTNGNMKHKKHAEFEFIIQRTNS
jgi:hypothetical protein